jgi:glycosyltransferase involved in cell wall biosynthesis
VRVALVHDWLTTMRGGERVLHEIAAVYPEADLFTLIHVPGATSPRIDAMRIFASPLSRLPGAGRRYRAFLPLFPWAVERFDFSGYELVLSSSHAFAKGARVPAGRVHVCYCLTPMRYVWDQRDLYLGRGLRRAAGWPLAESLRRWDRRTSGPDRITRVVAASHCVADRVRRNWGRDARVVHPPVDLDRFRPSGRDPDDYYLLVGAFVPYKRERLAVEAFRGLGRRLVVAGDGPGRAEVEASAPSNVVFTGRVSDERLAELYANCRALVFPQEEDFGIVALEAQASGRPVIAFGRGGATESVVPLDAADGAAPTGIWFHEQTADALADAVVEFERRERAFDVDAVRAHASQFGAPRFRAEIRDAVERALGEARSERVLSP